MRSRHAARRKLPVNSATVNWSEQVLKSQQIATCTFINTELEVAETFFNLASSTSNPNTRERNLQNAERAYSAALHFSENLSGHPAELQQVTGKLERLRSKLDTVSTRKIHVVPRKN